MDDAIRNEIVSLAYKAMVDKSDLDTILWEIARLATTGLSQKDWLDSLTVEGEFVEVAQ